MLVKVQKWGNSIAFRIPKSFAKQISVDKGSSEDLSVQDGKLVIKPITPESYELKELLPKVKETNLQQDYLNDKPRGKELW